MRSSLLFLFLFSVGPVLAQQDATPTQFWNHYTQFNPAMTAVQYDYFGAAAYRGDLRNTVGNPREIYANYQMLLPGLHGIGVNYTFDHLGFNRMQTANVNYSYQLRVSRTQRISFGAALGVKHLAVKPEWVFLGSQGPIIVEPASDAQPNINAGVAYIGKQLYGGIGVTNLLNPEFSFENSVYSFRLERNYYAHAAYVFTLGEKKNLQIQPQLLFRTDWVSAALNFNVFVKAYKHYWAAVGLKTRDDLVLAAGWDIKGRYRVGYSYDMYLGPFTSIWEGTHEFTLAFLIHSTVKPFHPQGTPDF